MTPRGRNHSPAAIALGAALCLLSGCGGEAGPPSHASPRLAVVQRDFSWKAVADGSHPPAEPLSRLWDFENEAPPWVVPPRSGQGRAADGVLTVSGAKGRVDVVGPGAGLVQPELQQWLSLRLRTTSAHTLRVFWRAQGEMFSPSRSTSAMRLDDSGEWATYSIAMASLRGVREAADAAEGVESFRLRFAAPGKAPVQVEIDRIVLLSDDDDPQGRGFTQGRLMRGGIARQGVTLRAPGAVTATLPAGGPDRLRMALAVAGAERPVTVIVGDAEGRIEPTQLALQPGAPWQELRLALPSRSGPLQLVVRADAPPGSRAVVLVGSVLRLAPVPQPGPSVILYVEDTLRADRLSLGPFLSALAGQGVTFTRAWSSSNWTRPAISSLLTSLDPVAHGNQVHTRRVPESLTTLTETLRDAGWITASFVTNYHAGSWAGLDQGFDLAAEPWAYGATRLTSTLTSSVLTDPLAAFLAEHADEQVLVFAHSLDPHAPYEPEPQDVAALGQGAIRRKAPEQVDDAPRWGRATRGYDAEVLHNDRELAALDAAIARLGLTDDTVFVFASDHGEAFGEHGRWEHRQDLHEEEVRVAWILRWPGKVATGRRVDAPVSLLDIAPTVLGLLGVPAPGGWQGRDLSPLCRSGGPGPVRPAPLYLDAVYDGPRQGPEHEVAVVAWPHKLLASVLEDGGLRPVALYDLDADPHERSNLLARPDHEQALAALLDVARERLDAGPRSPRAGADATSMDPAMFEWMQQMGYLR